MIRKVCIQLWNNKRSNGWLALELLLVFCFVWYLIDFFFVLGFNYSLKNYRDLNHTWRVSLTVYPDYHPAYQPDRSGPEQILEDYNRILSVLENAPLIESVGVSFYNSTPGHGGSYNIGLINPAHPENPSREEGAQRLTFCPQRDFLSVFRYTREKGTVGVNALEYDWSVPGGVLISRLLAKNLFTEAELAKGKSLVQLYGEDKYRVLDVIDDTKRYDSGRPANIIYIPERLSENNFLEAEISIRAIHSLSDEEFKADFLANVSNRLQIGNYSFKNIITYNKIHADTEKMFGLTTAISTRICMMLFLLFNVLLCLIGTMWYRVNRRKGEIGIRMAIGSDHMSIRNLFIIEVICMLFVIFPVALLLEFQIVSLDLLTTYGEGSVSNTYIIYRPLLRFMITNLLTFLLLTLVLVAAVWLPALKAAQMNPSDALRYE